MKNLLDGVLPTDMINVMLFESNNEVLAPNGAIPATAANVEAAMRLMSNARGGGGTNMLRALRAAFAIPRPVLADQQVPIAAGRTYRSNVRSNVRSSV